MKTSVLVVCFAAGLLAIHASNVPADPAPQYVKSTIEGVWEVVVTLRVAAPDCTTAALIPFGSNPFPSFNTFHEGGTMSEWGTRSPPATRSSGHGLWKRVGEDAFAYRLRFYSFDANGLLTARMDITSDLTLAPDGIAFAGVSRFLRTDLSGNVQNFCATLAGTRMSL